MSASVQHSRYFNLRIIAVLGSVTLMPLVSQAVPSFARQLDVSCTTCHTEFPILNELGRTFKLNGYTMSSGKSELPPLALMIQPSFTQTNTGQPGGAAPGYHNNSNFAVDQISIFYSGRLFGPYAEQIFGTDVGGFLNKFGTFIQTTYDGIGEAWSWDNAELRYSDNGMIGDKPVTYGFYLNNNPGMQDPWNTMPAWGFPFSGSALAPTPGAATLIDGGLGQQVLGLGGYMLISNSFYIDLAAYHTLSTGFQKSMGVDPNGDAHQVPGLAPYWRGAYTKSVGNQSYEVGFFGMAADTYPGRDSSAGKDRLIDWGIDTEYQASFDKSDITGLVSCIYENQGWDASKALGLTSNSSDELWAFKATLDYLYDKTYGGAIGYFFVNGSHDPVPGSGTKGSPLSDGLILQLNWMPLNKGGGPDFWPRSNVKFSLQYEIFNRFDGSRKNYDGAGRNASDNNTLYFQAWLAM